MSVPIPPAPLTADQIGLYDAAPPAIPSDDYTLTFGQVLTIPSQYLDPSQDGVAPPPSYQVTQPLSVTGPQLGLHPADTVATFPPAGSQADWSTVLPHVVLSRATLPWEVPAEGSALAGTPWLALLLLSLDGHEIVLPTGAPPGNATGTQTVALASYLEPPDAGTAGPVLQAGYRQRLEAENPDLQCIVVDVDATTFTMVAPRLTELHLLAHVRHAAASDQAIVGTGGGWFSLVVGNRLPGRAGGRFAAHLVSLQGFVDNLPGGPTPLQGKTAVRLLSLASWAFTSLHEGPDFLYLMKALSRDTLRLSPPPVAQPTLAQAAVGDALAKGYVGLAYRTRTGERTTAWYRGPCHPVQMARDRQPLYPTADAALLYDPSTGMFDTSFAAAWQLGRMLALANRKFTLTLVAWVRQHLAAAYLLAERLALFQGTVVGPEEVAALHAPDRMRRAATRLLAERLAPQGTGSVFAGLAPPSDPTRLQDRLELVPGVLGARELERVIASGNPDEALLTHLMGEQP